MTIWVVYLSSRSRFAVFSLSNHVKYAGRRTWGLVIIHMHRGTSMINTDITNKIKFFWLYSASYRTASSPSNSRCYNVLPDFPPYVNFQPWFFTVCQFPNLAFFFLSWLFPDLWQPLYLATETDLSISLKNVASPWARLSTRNYW